MHRFVAAAALVLLAAVGCNQSTSPGNAKAPPAQSGATPSSDLTLVTLKLPGMT